MKLSSILSEKEMTRLVVEAPMLGATPTTPGATTPPATGTTTMAPSQQVQQDPAAQAKMAAQQALDRQNRKKQIQDQIKQAQENIAALQKELATIK
jgi:hypothetical protein